MPNVNVTDAEAEFAKLLFPSLRTLVPQGPPSTYPGIRPSQLNFPGQPPSNGSPPPACPASDPHPCKSPACPGATLPPPPCMKVPSPINCGLPKRTVATCLPAAQNSMGWHSSSIGMQKLEAPDWGPGVGRDELDYTNPAGSGLASCEAPPPPTRTCGCHSGMRDTLLSIVDQNVRQGGVTQDDCRCNKPAARIVANIDQRIAGQNGAIIDVVGFIGITG